MKRELHNRGNRQKSFDLPGVVVDFSALSTVASKSGSRMLRSPTPRRHTHFPETSQSAVPLGRSRTDPATPIHALNCENRSGDRPARGRPTCRFRAKLTRGLRGGAVIRGRASPAGANVRDVLRERLTSPDRLISGSGALVAAVRVGAATLRSAS